MILVKSALATEEVTTATLKGISFTKKMILAIEVIKVVSTTTNMILATEEVITATLTVISATTKMILATEEVIKVVSWRLK